MFEILVWQAFTSIYGMMVVKKRFDPISENYCEQTDRMVWVVDTSDLCYLNDS
jgi:hypothetical protein